MSLFVLHAYVLRIGTCTGILKGSCSGLKKRAAPPPTKPKIVIGFRSLTILNEIIHVMHYFYHSFFLLKRNVIN